MRIVIVLVILSFILYSCQELTGEKPLSSVQKAIIDTSCLGMWKFVSYENYNQFELISSNHLLLILPFDKHEYLISIYPLKDSVNINDILFYKAHTSYMNGNTIANLQLITYKISDEYTYYAYQIQNDTLKFWGFYRKMIEPNVKTKKEIKSFLAKHINDTNYFSAVRKYIRIKTKDFLLK